MASCKVDIGAWVPGRSMTRNSAWDVRLYGFVADAGLIGMHFGQAINPALLCLPLPLMVGLGLDRRSGPFLPCSGRARCAPVALRCAALHQASVEAQKFIAASCIMSRHCCGRSPGNDACALDSRLIASITIMRGWRLTISAVTASADPTSDVH